MKILYFDCFSGISGDMVIGALLDLGLDPDILIEELKKLNLPGWEYRLERVIKSSISANYFKVITDEDHQQHHETHHHENGLHDGNRHTHTHTHNRSLTDINELIEDSLLTPSVKSLAKKIFYRVAVAEGKIHNNPPEQVHFHEVGAVDSIIDIVGAAVLIDILKPDKILSGVINDGHGFTNCQHGRIPVPVPAVAEILKDTVALRQIDIPCELVTPTGAAIIAQLSQSYELMPEMMVHKVGYGAGKRDNKIPNVLRVVLGETRNKNEEGSICVLETNIDDCSPEVLGYTMDKLLRGGASDVYFTNIYMKKNRPGVKLTVLCQERSLAAMEDIIFSETTTIGIRKRIDKRSTLHRRIEERDTPYGKIKVKIVMHNGEERAHVEYESAKKIAMENNIPIEQVYSLCREIEE